MEIVIGYFNTWCILKPDTSLDSLLCRTRESLASNTSSIVESNRRQNPALSPGHIGTSSIGLPFSFRAIPEPPTTQPEKLQKSSNCLASITSVWQAAQTETVKVVEERGREVFHHFDPRFPQPTHTYIHMKKHALKHTSSDSWESIYWDCYKNRHGFKRLFPQLQELYCKKKKTEEKLQNFKTTVGEETYMKYFDFGDMDSSLAYIKILDYWYWKVVDYRIQVTFGNIKKLFILLNNTCPIKCSPSWNSVKFFRTIQCISTMSRQ